jgi:RNA polymerase sigma-70 factor (ECF subfamily)
MPSASHPSGGCEGCPCELDALLCAMAERRCKHAFGRLYNITNSRLFGIVCRINRDPDEARDVTQEIYVKVWHHCGQFDRSRGPAQPWLSRIAHNHAVSSLRRRNARPELLTGLQEDVDPYEGVMSGEPGPEDMLIDAQRQQAVSRCLDALPLLTREALHLAYDEGLSHSDIAARLGWPLGTVKSCIRRALLGIGAALAAHR